MSGRGGHAIKNKQAADVQITAEQIMREAFEQQGSEFQAPKTMVRDEEELDDFRLEKRRSFEDAIRRNRDHVGNWLKYGRFEETQGELKRARNIYERAIEVDYRKVVVWLKYAEMEMRAKAVNRARNVWDRAVSLLPRAEQLWLKYALMEEALQCYGQARLVFERWMEWQPSSKAWQAYVRLEVRLGEMQRASGVYARWAGVEQSCGVYGRWAAHETRQAQEQQARQVFEAGVDVAEGILANEEQREARQEAVHLLQAFARFEAKQGEWQRARSIYRLALDRVAKEEAPKLYAAFVAFEKQHGDKAGIEAAIVARRRFHYEEQLRGKAGQYDLWFDYARLEEQVLQDVVQEGGEEQRVQQQADRVVEVYERAVAQVPPVQEKRHWRRYVYLWLQYAVFEELDRQRPQRARKVYEACLQVVPHAAFSFSKVWVLFARFELRQKRLDRARKVLGTALGKAPKAKLFVAYVELEAKLGSIERVRAIYEKWLQVEPSSCLAWTRYAALEQALEETERCRALYRLAVGQAQLDMPELVWKAYIDFEVEEEEHERARQLYEELLERTTHAKVWASYARFEEAVDEAERARKVFERAHEALRQEKEARSSLCEAWVEFEERNGSQEQLEGARSKLAKRVKRTRPIVADDGSEVGLEEYYDYVFADDVAAKPHMKLLQMAHKWKQNKKRKVGEEDQPEGH